MAASQPAAVAIAPAKQRRVRTIVIRLSAIAGAGVAVGTVAALTRGTPSKPPGGEVFCVCQMKIVTLSGTDGAGKSSQIASLEACLLDEAAGTTLQVLCRFRELIRHRAFRGRNRQKGGCW